jgi:hypothetical protein
MVARQDDGKEPYFMPSARRKPLPEHPSVKSKQELLRVLPLIRRIGTKQASQVRVTPK